MKYIVTNNYDMREFNTLQDCYDFIVADLKKHNLKYKRIFNKLIFSENKLFMQVSALCWC